MKVNILVFKQNGVRFMASSIEHMSVTGKREGGPVSFEDEIINDIDDDRMSPDKRLANSFLQFLSNRYLTIELLKQLSPLEQERIKKEFFDN